MSTSSHTHTQKHQSLVSKSISSRILKQPPPAAAAKVKIEEKQPVRLIWHRRDLRLHDNTLYSDLEDTTTISLYVFNPKDYAPLPSTCAPSKWDTVRIGPHFAHKLRIALLDLRTNLQSIGGELIVRTGDPVDVILELVRSLQISEVWWNEEPGTEEASMSKSVFMALCRIKGVTMKTDVGYALYHPHDLPTDEHVWRRLAHPKQKIGKKNKNSKYNQCNEITNINSHKLIDVSSKRLGGMCLVMGDYRRAVRSHAKVRPVLDAPTRLSLPYSALLENFDAGDIPTLESLYRPLLMTISNYDNEGRKGQRRSILGLSSDYIKSAVLNAATNRSNSFGESEALKRLSCFLSSGKAAIANRAMADVTTNDDSSKLSLYLSMGTLSPRKVYEEACKAGEGADWIKSHLEMRDYFVYYAFRSGAGLFRLEGAAPSLAHKKGACLIWNDPSDSTTTNTTNDKCQKQADHWEKWATGCTGFPLVDAAMKELLQTGYCSNRVRQNAASFLTKDLRLDWRAGAELFQFLLDDFCVAANWGNWAYFSGVGTDPKHRHFRTVSQALRYDPNGVYVKKWLYDLKGVLEKEALFRPWDFLETWPEPIVDPKTQFTWHDLNQYEQTGRVVRDEQEGEEVQKTSH